MTDITDVAEIEWALRECLRSNRSQEQFVRPQATGGSPCANLLLAGHFEEILELFGALLEAEDESELVGRLRTLQDSLRAQLEAVALAVASLQLFVQLNWTGRELKRDHVLPKASSTLESCGETVSPNAQSPELLALSRLVFSTLESNNNWVIQAWSFRALAIHQKVLTDRSEALYAEGKELVDRLGRSLDTLDPSLAVPLRLETGLFLFHFFDVAALEGSIDECRRATCFDFEETGVLGKRTKFQERNLAQLTLTIKSSSSQTEVRPDDDSDYPVDVKLDDEVRLDKIKFEDRGSLPSLGLLEQTILLASCCSRKRFLPKDELSHEQLMPYLEPILLSNHSTWALRMSALLLRSELESSNRRTVERAMMQVEGLVDSTRGGGPGDRLALVHASTLPPYWQVEQVLCQSLQSLGSTKAALDIALRLDLWEDVIQCYHQLQLRHKAAEVILQRLEKEETPLLYCLLGDATDKVEWYHKALELSNNRSARAFRSLGNHAYFRKEYKECLEHFSKSLDLNPFQLQTLLRLGFAASQVEDWALAAKTYRHYCSYESDNFEAWNNLANAYIKLGEKARAWKVLQEAVKCDFDNWRIWDNVLVVSTDCAHFEEVIRAYNRILDLKEKHVDVEVLAILAKAIISDTKDNFDRPAGVLRPAALKLLARLTSQVQGESALWEVYSDLVAMDQDSQEAQVRRCQYLQKAFSCFTQKNMGWQNEVGQCKEVSRLGEKYGQEVLRLSRNTETRPQAITLLSSVKMNVRGAVKLIESVQTSVETGEVVPELNPDYKTLVATIRETEELLLSLK